MSRAYISKTVHPIPKWNTRNSVVILKLGTFAGTVMSVTNHDTPCLCSLNDKSLRCRYRLTSKSVTLQSSFNAQIVSLYSYWQHTHLCYVTFCSIKSCNVPSPITQSYCSSFHIYFIALMVCLSPVFYGTVKHFQCKPWL